MGADDVAAGHGHVSVRAALDAVVSLVAEHRRELDRLNVFPVPDGDTGSNVLATVRAAAAAAAEAAGEEPGGTEGTEQRSPAAAAVDGALRGARGNSGVLVSQALRGLLAGMEDRLDPLTPARFAAADEHARAAVVEPVEGSLLSATRAAAVAAAAPGAGADAGTGAAVAVLDAARVAAHEAVARTPSQLEVLARAGVVDAGARAYALVLEALHAVVTDRPPAPPPVQVPEDGPAGLDCELGGGRYEVMYLLDPAGDVGALRAGLAAVGDSVVVVDTGELVSVHVHTDDIGAALERGLEHGRPHGVHVEDLHAAAAAADARGQHPAGRGPAGDAAVLAGVQGQALVELLTTTGAVPMLLEVGALPSVDELLSAVAATGAARVVLLPGHRDVVPTARQAASLAEGCTIEVVTGAVDAARVLAALTELDPTAPDAAVAEAAATAVTAGEVVAAVRAADTVAGPVRPGDWLAVVSGDVVAVAEDVAGAVGLLADALGAGRTDPPEVVTAFLGRDLQPAMEAALAALTDTWPTAELDVLQAGQHPAVLVVGIEG